MMQWHEYWFNMLEVVRQKSQDPSSKYGAVIVDGKNRVLSTGYNGIPRGLEYKPTYYDRPDKYMYFVHAEQNAVFNAAAAGTRIEDSTMYVLRPPCVECSKAIVQCGIRRVIYKQEHSIVEAERFAPDNWRHKMEAAHDILYLAGVNLEMFRRD